MKFLASVFLILFLSSSKLSAVVCACFYLETPDDFGLTMMENYSELIVETTVRSAVFLPYAAMMDYSFFKVEEAHNNSVKNVNMGVLENRESLKMSMKGLGLRDLRKNISCNTADSEIALLETQILYLEELLVEVSIESNKRIEYEKNRLLGK